MPKNKTASPERRVITSELKALICQRIADGEALPKICADYGIPLSTLRAERDKDPVYAEMYARAKEDQADHYADRMLAVADAEPRTIVEQTYVDEDGAPQFKERIDTGDVQHRKLLIDTLKWTASKLKPKVYGDKQTLEHTGKLTMEQLLNEPPIKPD